MKNWIVDFFKGSACVFAGCGAFCRNWRLWKYAVAPMLILLTVYALLFWGIWVLTGAAAERVIVQLSELMTFAQESVWLQNAVIWTLRAVVLAAGFFLAAISVSSLYELFGGIFFDAMTERFELQRYGRAGAEISWRQNVKFLLESLLYGCRNLLIFCVLFVISLLVLFGGAVLAVVMGYLLGVTYMISSANRNGMGLVELRQLARRKKALVLGFGVTAYLLLMIPFLSILFLPGLVLGGSVLLNEKLQQEV